MLTHSSISCQENTADRGTWVGGYSPWSCGELDVTGATKHAEKLLRLNTHAYVGHYTQQQQNTHSPQEYMKQFPESVVQVSED